MKKHKKLWIAVIAVVAICIVGVVVTKLNGSKKNDVAEGKENQTLLLPLEEQDLAKTINATGTVESQNVYSVTTDLTCKVKELPVALGDHVNEGDVLCVFDDTDVKEQIATLEKQASDTDKLNAKQREIAARNLEDAKSEKDSQIDSANSKITDAQNEYDKLNAAYQNGDETVTNEMVASAKQTLDTAKENLTQVEKDMTKAVQDAQDTVDTNAISNGNNNDTAKELAKLYRQLDEMTITAAQSGVITKMNIAQGGIPSGSLMQIEDDQNLRVSISVKEKDILSIKEGMKATISADALPDETYSGSVAKIINFASSSDETTAAGNEMGNNSKGSSYSAQINVDAGSKLLLGMTVKVEVADSESKVVTAVPYDSILTEEDNSTYVFRATADSNGTYTVEKIPVTVGDTSDYYTAITSDQLQLGDLIVNMPYEMNDGDTIQAYTPDDSDISTDQTTE